MGRKRGAIEVWLRKIIWGGLRDECTIYIRHRRLGVEELKPIPANSIRDLRRGYIVVENDYIPLHRVEEIICSGKRVFIRRKSNENY